MSKKILSSDPIFYVYALIDPFTRKPFYIGKGKRGRIYSHMKDFYSNKKIVNKHKDNKIKKILSQGGKVIHKKLKENLIEKEALRLEEKYIRYFGLENLTNLTYGGESGIPSSKTLRKLSILNKGKNNPMYGKTHTIESRRNISFKNKGKIISKEQKLKISLKLKGRIGTMTGKKQSDYFVNRMTGKNNPSAKRVLFIRDGKILKVYDCLRCFKKVWENFFNKNIDSIVLPKRHGKRNFYFVRKNLKNGFKFKDYLFICEENYNY